MEHVRQEQDAEVGWSKKIVYLINVNCDAGVGASVCAGEVDG